jgi:hypothetical protein
MKAWSVRLFGTLPQDDCQYDRENGTPDIQDDDSRTDKVKKDEIG